MMKIIVLIHFSLIKFNYTNVTNREKWFSFRVDLFLKATYSSIIKNSIKPEKIILLLDVSDKPLFKKYFKKVKYIYPIFTKTIDVKNNVISYLKNEYENEDILLSRIDSDDLISYNYFSEILKITNNIDKSRPIVVSKGYRTNFHKIMDMDYPNSPFISIIYNSSKNFFIYDFEHTEVYTYNPIIISTCSFIQISHGTNLANKIIKIKEYYYLLLKYYVKRLLFRKRKNHKLVISIKKYKENFFESIISPAQIESIITLINKYNDV